MAQSGLELSYRGLDVFWHTKSQEPTVPWKDWAQRFQLVVITKEKIDTEDMMGKKFLPIKNPNPTLEESVGKEDIAARNGM